MDKSTIEKNYPYFLAALKFVAKTRWNRQNQVLAEEANISRSFLSNILADKEKNHRPSYENQIALASVNNATYEEFIEEGKAILSTGAPKGALLFEITGENTPTLPEAVKTGHYVAVPLMDMSAAAGNGYEISEFTEVIKPLIFESSYLKKLGSYEHIFAMQVYGDSMEPVLPDGSLVMIDKNQTQLWQGKIYLIRRGMMLYVKYIEADSNKLVLKSANKPKYEDIIIDLMADQPEDFQILGRVIWHACED